MRAMEVSEAQQEAIELAFRDQLGTKSGRLFVMTILEDCGFPAEPFSGFSNHGTLAYNTGRRDVASELFDRVSQKQPELAVKMLTEWMERKDEIRIAEMHDERGVQTKSQIEEQEEDDS